MKKGVKDLISYNLMSDTGDRGNNEDCVGMYQVGDEYCFVLADGLGGHGKGEVASQIAVEQAVSTFARMGAASAPCVMESLQNGQREIQEIQKEDRTARDMKTTCVLLQIGEEMVRWAHIGDSRLYYFQNYRLVTRTLDHSVPQMLVAAGEIKEKQIRHHPDRNRLLRVMGIDWDEPKFQLGEPLKRESGQAFLLCSDGFWELIDEKRMASCFKKAVSPKDWLKQMEEIIRKQGRGQDMDNYSAIAVWID